MGQRVAFVECQCGHVGRVTDPEVIDRLGKLATRRHVRMRCSRCGAANQFKLTLAYDAGTNALASQKRDGV